MPDYLPDCHKKYLLRNLIAKTYKIKAFYYFC